MFNPGISEVGNSTLAPVDGTVESDPPRPFASLAGVANAPVTMATETRWPLSRATSSLVVEACKKVGTLGEMMAVLDEHAPPVESLVIEGIVPGAVNRLGYQDRFDALAALARQLPTMNFCTQKRVDVVRAILSCLSPIPKEFRTHSFEEFEALEIAGSLLQPTTKPPLDRVLERWVPSAEDDAQPGQPLPLSLLHEVIFCVLWSGDHRTSDATPTLEDSFMSFAKRSSEEGHSILIDVMQRVAGKAWTAEVDRTSLRQTIDALLTEHTSRKRDRVSTERNDRPLAEKELRDRFELLKARLRTCNVRVD